MSEPADVTKTAKFRAGFKVARRLADPKFRQALRAAGFVNDMTIDPIDVLDAIRADGFGGWVVTRGIRPVEPPPKGRT